MTDYDIEKVSPRPWSIFWDVTKYDEDWDDSQERLLLKINETEDIVEQIQSEVNEEWVQEDIRDELLNRNCYFIQDSNDKTVEHGMLFSSYGFRETPEDINHAIHCVNEHEALQADRKRLMAVIEHCLDVQKYDETGALWAAYIDFDLIATGKTINEAIDNAIAAMKEKTDEL